MRLPYPLLLAVTLCTALTAHADVRLEAAAVPVLRDAPRIGLNLGGSSTWGAEQLRTNVLQNPGFEPTIDRTLVVVGENGSAGVHDDSPWLHRAPGFWTGATFDVRSGAAAGQGGRVLDDAAETAMAARSRVAATVDAVSPALLLSPASSPLQRGDAITLTRTLPAAAPALWWIGAGMVQTSTATRPGSAGRQSVHLLALPQQPSRLAHHLDMIGDRAGRLLPVTGSWQLRFWARAGHAGTPLKIRFHRHGSAAFLDRSLSLSPDWHLYTLPFDAAEAADGHSAASLELSFELAQGEAWLDDAFLGPTQSGAGGFRPEVVRVLQRLHPGFLRDWQGQLGDTISNRLAGDEARQPSRYRPGDNEQLYFYSLPDFFALCGAIGAQPWVVAPSLASDTEWQTLGRWLATAAQQYGFREILVEFGNENWNSVFRPAGFIDARTHAAAADRAFRLMLAAAGHDARLVPVINAQYVNPDQVRQMAQLSHEASRISVAPYFLFRLDTTDGPGAMQAAFGESADLIRQDHALVKGEGKMLAASEVNFHTTSGNASAAERRQLLESAGAGPALARRLLQNLLSGVREQAVYTLAGFDTHPDSGDGLIPLWGVARDLAPGRLRSTGQAMALLNQAIEGDAFPVTCHGPADECAALTALLVRKDQIARWVITSAANRPIRLVQPSVCPTSGTMAVLGDAAAPAATSPALTLPADASTAMPGEAPGPVHKTWSCRPDTLPELPPHTLVVLETRSLPSPSSPLSRH